jgi:hypothetical protein
MENKELIITENDLGVFAISLVEAPAIEEDFIFLSKQHDIELKVADEDKMLIVGYALVPNKKILRLDKEGNEFTIEFSKETVRQSAELYLKKLRVNNTTVDHENKVDGVSVVESWITEDEKKDKISLYGIKPIKGGWAVIMRAENDEVWQAVKSGKVKGFSIEGKFSENIEKLGKVTYKNKYMNMKKTINKIFAKLGIEVKLMEVKSLDGSVTFFSETFEQGDSVVIRTADGDVDVPAGSYELENGLILVVEQDGIIASISEPAQEEEMQDEDTAEAPAPVKDPKKTVEMVTKEYHFAEIEAKDKEIEALKNEIENQKVELSKLSGEVEELSKVKPIVTNPEAKAKVDLPKDILLGKCSTKEELRAYFQTLK